MPQNEPTDAPDALCEAMPLSLSLGQGPDAVAVLTRAARDLDAGLVLLFGSNGQPPGSLLRKQLTDLPPGCDVISCCSAGTFHHAGYLTDGVVAIIFPRGRFRTRIVQLRDLSRHAVTEWIETLRQAETAFAPRPDRNAFGLLLTGAAGGMEEVVMATLDAALGGLNVVGGTIGDLGSGLACLRLNGERLNDTALVCLAETDLAVQAVVFSHFTPTARRMVVTEMSGNERTILRLNDEPAAEEYARLIGVDPGTLDTMIFARHPLLLRLADTYYVRAISAARADGGLELMSAVESGSLLTLGEASGDLDADFAAAMAGLTGDPVMVLGFDCVLRRYAVERSDHVGALAELFDRYRVAGLNTLGEQHGGMHVNQTFVGLAFMPRHAA